MLLNIALSESRFQGSSKEGAIYAELMIFDRAVASPRAGGEHEKIFTAKKGFFGIVPPLCPP